MNRWIDKWDGIAIMQGVLQGNNDARDGYPHPIYWSIS